MLLLVLVATPVASRCRTLRSPAAGAGAVRAVDAFGRAPVPIPTFLVLLTFILPVDSSLGGATLWKGEDVVQDD